MIKTFEAKKEDLAKIAEWLLKEIMSKVKEKGYFVALFGDLGAGKTAFVKEVAKILGVEEEIISPTFILKKEYKVDLLEIEKLVHVDAYRFESKKEGNVLRLEDDKEEKVLVFIEWPEKIEKREFDAELHFDYVDEDTRKIIATLHDRNN